MWLHNQRFYRKLQAYALQSLDAEPQSHQTWADVGCSTGLMCRLAGSRGYRVRGYDINAFSLWIARLLSLGKGDIHYSSQDFHTLTERYDVITATSLLSVLDDKAEALQALTALLKDTQSRLILIEPTEKMTVANVHARIDGLTSWWYYKGLLLWAKAREGKAMSLEVFETLGSIEVSHDYALDGMVRISLLKMRG